jgi:hypothetical protein
MSSGYRALNEFHGLRFLPERTFRHALGQEAAVSRGGEGESDPLDGTRSWWLGDEGDPDAPTSSAAVRSAHHSRLGLHTDQGDPHRGHLNDSSMPSEGWGESRYSGSCGSPEYPNPCRRRRNAVEDGTHATERSPDASVARSIALPSRVPWLRAAA